MCNRLYHTGTRIVLDSRRSSSLSYDTVKFHEIHYLGQQCNLRIQTKAPEKD